MGSRAKEKCSMTTIICALDSDSKSHLQTIAIRRRRMLERRYALEEQWPRLFPQHDFATLRLIQPSDVPAWDEETLELWRQSARAYDADRQKWGRR
jgi:hypothetical protein